MTDLEKLIDQFERFPGVGSRQAKRFVFHILTMNKTDIEELGNLIISLKQTVIECASCHRFYSATTTNHQEHLCTICQDATRDRNKLLVVAHDSDIQAVERSGTYTGLYFVLGGLVPLLHSEENKRLRGGSLKATIEARLPHGLSEIILAFAVNPDGENTSRYVESIINGIDNNQRQFLAITQPGRGLSTGSELEYADPETIKSALEHRI